MRVYFETLAAANQAYPEERFGSPKMVKDNPKEYGHKDFTYHKYGKVTVEHGFGWQVMQAAALIWRIFFGKLMAGNYTKGIKRTYNQLCTGEEKVNVMVLNKLSILNSKLHRMSGHILQETKA